MSVDSELKLNRRNTAAFIAARPSDIALTPTISTKNSSGGVVKSDGPARAVQTLRLVESPSAYGNNPGKLTAGDAGKQERVDYQLVGEYDASMEVGDHWTVGTIRYEVVELLPFNGYERRGQVRQYGG